MTLCVNRVNSKHCVPPEMEERDRELYRALSLRVLVAQPLFHTFLFLFIVQVLVTKSNKIISSKGHRTNLFS